MIEGDSNARARPFLIWKLRLGRGREGKLLFYVRTEYLSEPPLNPERCGDGYTLAITAITLVERESESRSFERYQRGYFVGAVKKYPQMVSGAVGNSRKRSLFCRLHFRQSFYVSRVAAGGSIDGFARQCLSASANRARTRAY